MNLHILRLPKLIAERRSSAIFGIVIIAMIWAAVILKYSEDVQADLKEAERGNHNFAMVFEENVLRSIGEIDKALLYLRRSIETRKDSTDFATIANTTDVLSEIIVQVAIIDAAGIMRASNVGAQPAPPLDLSDRDHYKVHVNSSEDQLFISKPVIGRASGKWSVQFSRRFLNRDKTFGGVAVASLDPDHLTRFYNKIDFGTLASISLIGSDGIVRSSGGNAGGFALGQDLRGTKLFDHMRAGATSSTFEDSVQPNGGPCLITLRKVKDHPLWVSVTTNKDEIYKSSWADLQVDVLAAAALTLIILFSVERILRTEAGARLKAEQLQLTLENMSQGIMLVTKDLQVPSSTADAASSSGCPRTSSSIRQGTINWWRFKRGTFRPRTPRRSPHCREMAPQPALPRGRSRSVSGPCRMAPSWKCAAGISPTAALCRPLPTSPSGARRKRVSRGSPPRIL